MSTSECDEGGVCIVRSFSKQERTPVRTFGDAGQQKDDGRIVEEIGEVQSSHNSENKCFRSIADIVKLLPYVKKFKKVILKIIYSKVGRIWFLVTIKLHLIKILLTFEFIMKNKIYLLVFHLKNHSIKKSNGKTKPREVIF